MDTTIKSEAPTRAQYITIHGSDSCIKQLKADLKCRAERAVLMALWTESQRAYIERAVGEYLEERLQEASTLFITDRAGTCVVTAGRNGSTIQVEIAGRSSSDCSLDVVIDVETLRSAVVVEPLIADALDDMALTGKVKVNVAGTAALTAAYYRYLLEFKPLDIRDLSWMLK